MKKLFVITVVSIITAFGIFRAEGQTRVAASEEHGTKEVRLTGEYNAVKISGPVTINYTVADGPAKIEMKGPENLLSYVKAGVKGNTLEITMDRKNQKPDMRDHTVVMEVTGPALKSYNLHGAVKINVIQPYSTEDLDIRMDGVCALHFKGSVRCRNVTVNMTGASSLTSPGMYGNSLKASMSGKANVDLNDASFRTISTQVSGAGTFSAAGTADIATFRSSGASRHNVAELHATDVNIILTGAGGIDCHAKEEISGSVSRVARLNCYGSPTKVNIRGDKKLITIM